MTTFEKELSKNQLEDIDIINKYHIEKQKVRDAIELIEDDCPNQFLPLIFQLKKKLGL